MIEEGQIDYEIGFGRLADPEDLARSIAVEAEFEFTEECQYGAFKVGSKQFKAINDYQRNNKLAVYYQFYNPWSFPFVQRIPLAGYEKPVGKLLGGTRIMPAKAVHQCLAKKADGSSPALSDLKSALGIPFEYGWPLSHFVSELFLKCHEGSQFDNIAENRIQDLFYRRSGPIAAAIVITIEGPPVTVDQV